MAQKNSTKAAVLDKSIDAEVEEAVEASVKQIIADGITRFSDSVTVTGQHFRYKSLRAIAYQAFSNAIAAGEFDDLVDEAIANVDELPFGWEVERGEKEEAPAKPAPAKATKASAVKTTAKTTTKTPAKAPAKKAAAKPAAKPAAAPRRRPTR